MSDQDLREAGLKVTLPRLKILKILENAQPHHMRAEDIYKRLADDNDDVGLATVYRVLTQFEAAGLVKRHNFATGHSVFELDQGEHHDHFVCTECGHVEEFVDDIIEQRQDEWAKKLGFVVTHHNHTIYGLCANCKS